MYAKMLRNKSRMLDLILSVSLLLLSGELAAQTFKCTNAAGKITYSGVKCGELGLKDAGEVKDRLNVNPVYKPPAPARQPPAPARTIESRPSPAPAAKAPNTEVPAAAEDPANPDRRCFTVHTAKGNITRCNDKTGDDQ
jgi:hypothetical protein